MTESLSLTQRWERLRAGVKGLTEQQEALLRVVFFTGASNAVQLIAQDLQDLRMGAIVNVDRLLDAMDIHFMVMNEELAPDVIRRTLVQ